MSSRSGYGALQSVSSQWLEILNVSQTVSSLGTFVLAMLLYPKVQRTAQEEIDRVVGLDRLPGFEEMDALPYLTAVMKETLR